MQATAQIKEATRDGEIHQSFEPIPRPGILFDPHGDRVTPKVGLMARLDAKVSEDITLKKGTLALIVAGFVLLQVIFNYGGSFVGWARDDQSQKEQMITVKNQVDETRKDMKELKEQFNDIQKALQAQAIQAARGDGYKLGVTETQADHGKKVK